VGTPARKAGTARAHNRSAVALHVRVPRAERSGWRAFGPRRDWVEPNEPAVLQRIKSHSSRRYRRAHARPPHAEQDTPAVGGGARLMESRGPTVASELVSDVELAPERGRVFVEVGSESLEVREPSGS
jgi:hypothetical protein